MKRKEVALGFIGCGGMLCVLIGVVGLVVVAFLHMTAVKAQADAKKTEHLARVEVARAETERASIEWAAKVRIEEIQAESNAARYATTSTAQKLTVFGLLTALAMVLSYMKAANGIESDSGLIGMVKDVADRMREGV